MLGAFYSTKAGAKFLFMGASLNRPGAFFSERVQICTRFAPGGVWRGKKGHFEEDNAMSPGQAQNAI